MGKKINIILFWCFIAFFTISYEVSILKGLSSASQLRLSEIPAIARIRDHLYSNYEPYQQEWVNLYGTVLRVTGKDWIKDFTVCRTDYGKLAQPREAYTEEERRAAKENLDVVYAYTQEAGIPAYYITSLQPIEDNSVLAAGANNHTAENAAVTAGILKDVGIPLINLKEKESIQAIPWRERFYLTDHHWNLKTAFAAYSEIIWHLEQELGMDLSREGEFTDLGNYDIHFHEKDFLGSYGVNAGEYYVGKEGFEAYIPTWETSVRFEAFQKGDMVLEREGTVSDALYDWEILNDRDFYDKRCATLFNECQEIRIKNNLADNELKLLLISHSYGWEITAFMAPCFAEVVNLDPQEGRYNGNYLDYIKDYQPDIVLIMTEFEGKYNVLMNVGE